MVSLWILGILNGMSLSITLFCTSNCKNVPGVHNYNRAKICLRIRCACEPCHKRFVWQHETIQQRCKLFIREQSFTQRRFYYMRIFLCQLYFFLQRIQYQTILIVLTLALSCLLSLCSPHSRGVHSTVLAYLEMWIHQSQNYLPRLGLLL